MGAATFQIFGESSNTDRIGRFRKQTNQRVNSRKSRAEGVENMASTKSEILAKVIRTVKPLITGMDLQGQRVGQAMLSRVKTLPKDMKIRHAGNCPLNAEWILPKDAPGDVVLLYMHGGSYRTGDLIASRGLIAYICKACGLKALSFEYRLAPEFTYPAALEDAIKAYLWLLEQGYRNDHIAMIGDSAGGGLIVAATLALKDMGKPLPAGLMCISPWVDLTETSRSHAVRENEDPLLDSDYLLKAALEYSGEESLFHPYISPVFGNFEPPFPEVQIHVGTREVLFDDAVHLERKLKEGGVPVTLEIFKGMWHVWHVFNVPEAEQALLRIREFMRRKLQVESE